MATASNPHYFVKAENRDDDPSLPNSHYYTHDDTDQSQSQGTPMRDDVVPDLKPAKDPNTLQKRRRVTRACDECRRKKIKCDGKQPCTHCTVYSYECTYDQPSNRRRNPAPQYVEALETRLHKAEALLKVVVPDLNLDDPQFDAHATEKLLAAMKKQSLGGAAKPSSGDTHTQPDSSGPEGGDESLLETMVDNSGCLDVDDQGHWDYHGHTSSITFLRRLRKQLGATEIQLPMRSRPMPQILDSPKSLDSPPEAGLPPTHDLPSRAVAQRLCNNALDDGCSLMRFVHEPSFYVMLSRVYDTPLDQFTNEENSFLPLLYIVMSVGCLFSDDGAGTTLNQSGYESAIGQGFQYFKAGRQLLDITDCRDLTSLQAICFMVLFLQSSAKLSTCYSYVGIALRSALRLGLHRSVTANFNPIERELRKRIFWVIRKMDAYVSTLLGLPQMLSDDDIDQEFPADVDSEFISVEGITPMPTDRTPVIAAANAHTRLADIIMKVVKIIYPLKPAKQSKSDHHYLVSHANIREIERDLQAWMEGLPPALRPGTEVSLQLERIRQLLRISYAHVQMVLYRPFLHYVSSGSQARGVDKRSYACAAACVSVARNIVHITTGMHKRGLLNGSYWFTMYTTYFAILSLVFFVLENPDSPTAKDGVLKEAMEGKNTLAGLAKKSLAADRCSHSLTSIFKNLPELLKKRQSSKAPVNLKRPAPSSKPIDDKGHRIPPEHTPPQRASTFPAQLMSRSSANEASNVPKTLDDSAAPRNLGTWTDTTPELSSAIGTPSETLTPDQLNPPSVPSLPTALPNQDLSALQMPQQFDNIGNVPDLMPIMFPSDDPFAYPTQPMSTLEDGHFRQNGLPLTFSSTSQKPGISTTQPTDPTGMTLGMSNATYDSFPNYPAFSNGLPTTTMGATVPSPFQHRRHASQPQHRSPLSQSPRSAVDTVNSPDLVSIPNQNFAWQNYNFQQQNMPDTSSQQQMPALNGSQDFDLSMNDVGLDLGLPLDDILGNDVFRPSGAFSNDDWMEWMNASA